MSGSRSFLKTKIASYLGLSLRAGKAVLGADNICESKPLVVIADPSLSPNALKKVGNRCNYLGIRLIMIEGVGELIAKPSCKAIGVKEPNLAKAILDVIDTVSKENSEQNE
jgi:ribosomal protein L7Ae-like RNA K-turn-binding protein